jgi:hypothetical protein
MKQTTLAVRVNQKNPDHHLWNNNGTWWSHFTLHLPDFTKVRIRQSLETKELTLARARRDALLNGEIAAACCTRSTKPAPQRNGLTICPL